MSIYVLFYDCITNNFLEYSVRYMEALYETADRCVCLLHVSCVVLINGLQYEAKHVILETVSSS